jgi:hypothetical protein
MFVLNSFLLLSILLINITSIFSKEYTWDSQISNFNLDNKEYKKSSSLLNVTATIPFQYPLFKQCDSTWGDDYMGTKTICMVGCLMSSTSMGLKGTDINIESLSSDPQTLNNWLLDNGGYDNNNLIESQVPLINPDRIFWPADAFHSTNDLPFSTITSYLDKGRVVIANVNDGGHFVLLVGYGDDNDTFYINDPGYTRDTYSYSTDVVGYRIFDMVRV